MNLSAVLHRPTLEYIYPRSRQSLEVSLTTARGDMAAVNLLFWGRYETETSARRRVPMRAGLRDGMRDYFSACIEPGGVAAYVRYCFELVGLNGERLWLGADGFQRNEPDIGSTNFFEFLWPNAADGFSAPGWSSAQVYYQIVPERFRNGDGSLSPPNTEPWGSKPTRENFMGGDLPGIIEKLDYIADLGATCIYLTPVFASLSNHKYDTIDYYKIDPHFGMKDDLKRLVDGAHKRGMRVILDGVFNHCGYYWPIFQDVVRNSATSKYKDWFFVQRYPVKPDPECYDCVGHYKWMPKLNLSNKETRCYFIGVGKYWLRESGADGWRLDVADEVPVTFWEEFAYEVKREFPDCVLIGETWGDAGKLVEPGRLDGAMNYLFRDAARDWLALGKINASEFAGRANRMLSLYPYEVDLRMYNPLDSHDTVRFLTYCGGNEDSHRLAVALQMTFPGCPAVYYGDEVGMDGGNDPDCRKAMDWERADAKAGAYEWYRRLIALRKSSKALTRGDFHVSLCDDAHNACGYCRTFEDESLLVIINAGTRDMTARAAVPHTGEWEDVLGGVTAVAVNSPAKVQSAYDAGYMGILEAYIPARSVKIFINKRK